jgi:hypothetical protein
MRMLMSVGPPAGNGTTILIGRLGKLAAAFCAEAGAANEQGQHNDQRAEPHLHAPQVSARVTSSNNSSTVKRFLIICCFTE